MLRVGQHIIAGQAVVAVGQGVTHVGVTVAGVGAVERCRGSHTQRFAFDQVGQRSRGCLGGRAAVVDLARRGDVAGKGRRRDVGLALGHAVAQRVVVGVRPAQHSRGRPTAGSGCSRP
ncbi:hypothetical protein G6F32_015440 [Rhizopus arrhizus]|nr:hypothetical protein G6F32_015440 [Rhizopus arrhizus]